MPVDWGEKFAWLIEVMKPYYAQKMKYGTGVITRIQEENNNSGRVNGAYATIDGDVDQFVDLSMNQGIQKNDVIVFSKDENMINSEWKPHKILRSRQAVSAPNVNRKFMPPIVSGADVIVAPGLGGVVSVPDTDPTDDPTGVLQAAAYIHFLAISQEQYNAYDYGYTGVKIRYRVVGETDPGTGQQVDWKKELSFPLTPKEVNTAILNADINNSATGSIAITIPDRFLTTILRNTACWWKIGEEIVLANIPSGADTAINIIARAQLGTSAVAHLTGETIVLLSSRLLLENLRPSTSTEDIVYQYQLAFYDNFNIPGMWSEAYSFTSYKITTPPAAPASLSVIITKDGYKLAWPKVPNQHVKQYRVYRYTSNPANGGGDANYSSAQGMPGTTSARVGNVNQVNWPVDQYTGDGKAAKYFCVVAEDDTGNLSVATAWTADTTAPAAPNPSYVTIEAVAEGPKIIISNSDISDRDEGWATYVLWQATNTSGGSKAIVARFKDREFTYTADPAGAQYYQVTCEDLIGNVGSTTDNATYWKRDDGTPSAPAGLSVTSVKGGFKISWTRPSYSALKNISHFILERHDNAGSGRTVLIDKNQNSYFWAATDVPIIANLASYSYFVIGVYDYNGNFSGYSSNIQDNTAPAAPSAANVRITADRGFIRVNINNNETPHLDESWMEYRLLRSDTGSGSGTNVIVAAQFNGKAIQVYQTVYSNYYYQVVSADWAGNQTAANGSAWVRAQVLYPTDSRILLPANGNFQELDPTDPTTPLWWALNVNNYTKGAATDERVFSSTTLSTTGGVEDSNCILLTLGSNSNGAVGTSIGTTPLMPYNPYDMWIAGMWVKIPRALVNGDIITIKVARTRYVNNDQSGGSDSATLFLPDFYIEVVTSPSGSHQIAPTNANQWIYIESEPISFVGSTSVSNYRFASFRLVSFRCWRTSGSPTAFSSGDIITIDNILITSYKRPSFV